jgi:BirA family biotin operon repressor/biotin-[acetyl-CoA-carboxylase] ligase
MAVVLCQILENYGVNPEIKWPNDVLIDNKKIAGILIQGSSRGNILESLVLGVGINLNLSKQDLISIDQPATSLNLLLEKPVNRDSFIEALLDEFFRNYDIFISSGFSFINNDYVKRFNYIGKEVFINISGIQEKVFIKELKNNGSLVVIMNQGNEKIIHTGEITDALL